MIFIDKSKSQPIANRLHDWRDTYVYAKDEYPHYKGLPLSELCQKAEFSGNKLWALLNNDKPYRRALRKEQNNLCCYCCEELKKGDGTTAIEHFEDKGNLPCVRTFDYYNLMIACEGNKNPRLYTFGRSDSWESIAIYFQTTPESLKLENPNLSFQHGDSVKIKLTHHCDVAKQNISIPINPIQDRNCWKRFQYDSNGYIKETPNDMPAKETIETLKLNADVLKLKREAAWKDAQVIYDENRTVLDGLLEEGDLEGYIQKISALKKEADTKSFCPVYWYYYENS